MKMKLAALAAIATLALTACSVPTDASTKDALPQADNASSSSSAAAPAAKKKAAAPAKPKASTCDVAREAILTGTKADIAKAFKALQVDKTADATAREYARYYLGRDAGQKDMQEMDISLIQTACSV